MKRPCSVNCVQTARPPTLSGYLAIANLACRTSSPKPSTKKDLSFDRLKTHKNLKSPLRRLEVEQVLQEPLKGYQQRRQRIRAGNNNGIPPLLPLPRPVTMTLRLLISSGFDYHRLAVATLAPTKPCFAEKLCSCAICRSAAPQLQEALNGSKRNGAAAIVMAGQRTDSCLSYRNRARPSAASTGQDTPEISCTRITRSDET